MGSSSSERSEVGAGGVLTHWGGSAFPDTIPGHTGEILEKETFTDFILSEIQILYV